MKKKMLWENRVCPSQHGIDFQQHCLFPPLVDNNVIVSAADLTSISDGQFLLERVWKPVCYDRGERAIAGQLI